jgi:hypothetical protein
MNNRSGNWWLVSHDDPRWNCCGETSSCGGFEMPAECKMKVDELTLKFGNPPKDLTFEYMKD